MNPGELRRCPDCNGTWPKGPQYRLQGTGWLSGLGRHISQSNFDVLIHDGAGQRNRFLLFELKGPEGRDWPLSKGQEWMLRALSGQSNWTVSVLRGTTDHAVLHRVLPSGIVGEVIHTHTEAVRRAVNGWLAGGLWRDAEDYLRKEPAEPGRGHIHGWARVEGIWTCIGDHYAAGLAEQEATACGATLPQFP